MELYTVVEVWNLDEYDEDTCLFQPNIICDSLKLAREYVECQIISLKERKDKPNMFFKIFKYELNVGTCKFVENINL